MKFRIIKRKSDCVLLYKPVGNDAKYVVKDIEGDMIYMSINNLKGAEQAFEEYDINKVRKEKETLFLQWLDENAEA